MSDRISWITYKGQKIIRADYRGLRGDEFLPIIDEVPAFYKGQSNKSVLALTDVRGAYATQAVMDRLKQLSKFTNEYDKKAAVVGVTGVKRALLSTYNFLTGHTVKAFDEEQEALEWLVS